MSVDVRARVVQLLANFLQHAVQMIHMLLQLRMCRHSHEGTSGGILGIVLETGVSELASILATQASKGLLHCSG